MSLFRKPDAFQKVIDLFSDYIKSTNAEVIVGLEARGFILGGAIAYKLHLPFVPVRKKGKLPGKIVSYKYELEYGSVSVIFV
jgi:adenine phosphoribosyltransferase